MNKDTNSINFYFPETHLPMDLVDLLKDIPDEDIISALNKGFNKEYLNNLTKAATEISDQEIIKYCEDKSSLEYKYKTAILALQAISQRDTDWSRAAFDMSKCASNCLKHLGEKTIMSNKENKKI